MAILPWLRPSLDVLDALKAGGLVSAAATVNSAEVAVAYGRLLSQLSGISAASSTGAAGAGIRLAPNQLAVELESGTRVPEWDPAPGADHGGVARIGRGMTIAMTRVHDHRKHPAPIT